MKTLEFAIHNTVLKITSRVKIANRLATFQSILHTLHMVSNFFGTIYQIFSVYPSAEAFVILGNYLRIIMRNRWPFIRPYGERIITYEVEFPNRPYFFGTLTEIFFRRIYRLPAKDPKTIIDAGANIGLATLYFKWRCPNSSVLCFEPNPEVLEYLKKNISHNHLSQVKIFPFALGKRSGETELYTNPLAKGWTSATTIAPKNVEQSIKVPMRRLSDFIDSPVDFLKLDVEGAEGEVLTDLDETGKLQLVRDMVIEYHQDSQKQGYALGKLLSLLEKNNFLYLCFPLFSDVQYDFPKDQSRYMLYAHRFI